MGGSLRCIIVLVIPHQSHQWQVIRSMLQLGRKVEMMLSLCNMRVRRQPPLLWFFY